MKNLLLSSLFLLGGLYSIAQVTAPWAEPFTGSTNPAFWTQSATTGGPWTYTGNPGYDVSGTLDHTNGVPNNYAWIDFSGTDVGVILTTPVIDVTALTVPELRFWTVSHYLGTLTPYNSIFVEASDGLGGWTTIDEIVGETGSQWVENTYIVSTYTYGANLAQFRFRAESGGASGDFNNDLLLDDVSVIEAPTCPAPIALATDSSNLTSGSFSWTPTGTETEWEIEYGPVGFTPGTGTSVFTSPNPNYTITGLTSNSFYDVYVMGVCGAADSSFQVGPSSFNTYNQGQFMEADTECPAIGFIDISTTGTPTDLSVQHQLHWQRTLQI